MKKLLVVLPIMIGWYVMGFCDLIGAVMKNVKDTCGVSDGVAGFLPSMVFLWFFLLSVPSGMLASRIGRKNTVLVSMAVTAVATAIGYFAGTNIYLYFAAFALLGIGNTIVQAALPGLFANVSTPDKMTSLISFGQFTKAICSAMSPLFVWCAATALGDWRLLFPIYGVLTVIAGVWLMLAKIPREAKVTSGAGFLDSLALLKIPFIFLMFTGVFASVAADVGFNVFAKQYLIDGTGLAEGPAGIGQTVYFVAKMIGAFVGAILFAKVRPEKCYVPTMLLALVPALCLFAPLGDFTTPLLSLTAGQLVAMAAFFLVGLGLANTFGIAMGLALSRYPEKTTQINGLMIMAVSGGALTPPIMGLVGYPAGALVVLLVTVVYMLGLAVSTARTSAH